MYFMRCGLTAGTRDTQNQVSAAEAKHVRRSVDWAMRCIKEVVCSPKQGQYLPLSSLFDFTKNTEGSIGNRAAIWSLRSSSPSYRQPSLYRLPVPVRSICPPSVRLTSSPHTSISSPHNGTQYLSQRMLCRSEHQPKRRLECGEAASAYRMERRQKALTPGHFLGCGGQLVRWWQRMQVGGEVAWDG
jgi:hypothetical protein